MRIRDRHGYLVEAHPKVLYNSGRWGHLNHVEDLLHDQHGGFTLALLDSLFSKGLRTVKSIPPKCRLGFSRVLKGALDKVIYKPKDISCWVSYLLVLPLCILKTFCSRSNVECKYAIKRQRQEESIINAIRSWSVASGRQQLVREVLAESSLPLLDVDEEDLDLGEQNIKQCKRKICDGHYTAAVRVLSSFGVAPYNDATLEDLKSKHPFKPAPSLPHTQIDHHHLIASPPVVLDRIKSFPRGTSRGRDGLRAQHLLDCLSGAAVAISDELVSSITLVVNLFLEGKCPKILGEYIASAPLTPLVMPGDGYLDDVQFGVGVSGGGEAILHVVNHLIEDYRDDVGLSMKFIFVVLLSCIGWNSATLTKLDYTTGNTPYGHAKGCNRDWYLDDDTIVGDTLVVRKEDPRSRLEGVFPPDITRPLHGVKLLGGPVSVDFDFNSELVMKRVAKTIGLVDAVAKINDPQCELLLLRAFTGIFKLYFAMRTYYPWVFEMAQCSFKVALHCALERIVTTSGPRFGDWQWRLATLPFLFGGISVYSAVASGPTFNDALCVFNAKMKTALLSNPSLWQSQIEDHTSGWLRVVPISGLGQTMNACSRVFTGDICGDHAVSCAGIIGIKHRHNMVRETLVDICFWSGISAGKEVDIGLGSSPLTQTRLTDFFVGRAVVDVAHRKRVKYEEKCGDIRYGFLPFSFSSFGE
ncbi:hypothetical protein Tco_1224223, partial [Tanacetum coccineum]